MDQTTPHKTRDTETYRGESGEEPQRGSGEKFLNRRAMACFVRSRIDKWDLIKVQSFCKAKDTFNRTKRPTTDWERIFTYPKSDRGLISNTYKELKKVDSRKSNNPTKKWGSELNKEFSSEEYQMVENHLKICSTSLVIRKCKIRCWQGCREKGTPLHC